MTVRVIALTDDVMVGTRIAATLEAEGYAVRLVGTADELRDAAREGAGVALVSFAARGFDALAAIRTLRDDVYTAALPVIAFGPHVDTAGQEAARAAGAIRVVPNSLFFTRMGYVVGQLLSG